MGKGASKGPMAEYQVTVSTSQAYFGSGGSSHWVYIDMTGENGDRTDWVQLDNFFEGEFRRGETDVFRINAMDVGLPVVIRIGLRDNEGKDPWCVQEISVRYGREMANFPVYDWIKDEMYITRAHGFVSHKLKSGPVASMRAREVEKSKALLQWNPPPGPHDESRGLPGHVKIESIMKLPLIFTPTDVRAKSLLGNAIESSVERALKQVSGALIKMEDLKSYERLYEFSFHGGSPDYIKRWKTDEEFGRQQLNGIAPLSIKRCTKLPECCKISDDDVKDLLGGAKLAKRMKEGKIFIGDYTECFQGVKRNKNGKKEQLYCPDAICLFHVNDSGNLVPFAIQLAPHDPDTVFTSLDSEEDWLLAKMYVKVAFANMHEWYYHFLLTHQVMEPFSVALFRCLPRSHPIYKLLRPHLINAPAINAVARATLTNEDSSLSNAMAINAHDLTRHMYKNFTLDDLHIPSVIKRNGLDDCNSLPKFYFRDDALMLWEIMENFVTDVIGYYYHNDEDVKQDDNLQDFVKDLAVEGFGWKEGDTKNVPFPIKSKAELIRLCMCAMFTSSASHAAINFQQFNTYKYIPNTPTGMRLPPHKKGEATMDRIMSSLPDIEMSTIVIATTFTISGYSKDEIYIGDYPTNLFCEPSVLKAMEDYKKALQDYSDKVKERNSATEFPYIWLLPEKVPNSVAV